MHACMHVHACMYCNACMHACMHKCTCMHMHCIALHCIACMHARTDCMHAHACIACTGGGWGRNWPLLVRFAPTPAPAQCSNVQALCSNVRPLCSHAGRGGGLKATILGSRTAQKLRFLLRGTSFLLRGAFVCQTGFLVQANMQHQTSQRSRSNIGCKSLHVQAFSLVHQTILKTMITQKNSHIHLNHNISKHARSPSSNFKTASQHNNSNLHSEGAH